MATRITVDPVTRIEGHLRIDCEVDNGKVTNAWSSGQMWRGIELILQGAIPAAILALLVQGVFELIERSLLPRGLRPRGNGRTQATFTDTDSHP